MGKQGGQGRETRGYRGVGIQRAAGMGEDHQKGGKKARLHGCFKM